jgi:hypothetical protein
MTVLFHYSGEALLFLPTAVMALLDGGSDFLDLLPAYLIQEKMGPAPAASSAVQPQSPGGIPGQR